MRSRTAGITATNDIDAILALDADCVCSAASGDEREAETDELMCRMLTSGKNIVSTSVVGLVYLPSFPDQTLVRKLETACRQSGTSVGTGGARCPPSARRGLWFWEISGGA